MRTKRSSHRLVIDAAIVLGSVALAVLLARSGVLKKILDAAAALYLLGPLIGGFFFTSAFTIAPAAVLLGTLAAGAPLLLVAGIGAVGALLGDIILFIFVRDRLAEDIGTVFNNRRGRRFLRFLNRHGLRFISPVLGALVIASPLPDELGLTLLGLSHVRFRIFVPISLLMNFLGILAVGIVAGGL